VTFILIKVKLCNALLRLLLVCIGCCLKSVLRLTVLILDTCQPDTLYLREQGSEDPRLLFEAQKISAITKVWDVTPGPSPLSTQSLGQILWVNLAPGVELSARESFQSHAYENRVF
jgi:hypothetical protein